MSKLIIEGNAVYEIDEDCMKKKNKNRNEEYRMDKKVVNGDTKGSKSEWKKR